VDIRRLERVLPGADQRRVVTADGAANWDVDRVLENVGPAPQQNIARVDGGLDGGGRVGGRARYHNVGRAGDRRVLDHHVYAGRRPTPSQIIRSAQNFIRYAQGVVVAGIVGVQRAQSEGDWRQ